MIQFQVSLILADKGQSLRQLEELEGNCTFVKNNLWIFEGDVEFLGAKFKVLDEGAVGSLGGLSEKELVKICKETFEFDHSLI